MENWHDEELKEVVQEELNDLVKEVLEKQDRIIPIIGNDCFVGYIDDNRQTFVPLQQWLAEELLRGRSSNEIKEKIAIEGYHGLDILLKEYRNVFGKDFRSFKNSISHLIEKGIQEKRLFLRKDVAEFLDAGKFEVVVTTCPHDALLKEMPNSAVYHICSYSPKQFSMGGLSISEATLDLPCVYQLFGNFKNDFVSGEAKLLEFLHYLNQTDTEKGYGASQLVKYIKDKSLDNKGYPLLMPIGCNNLPNWIFRFLWYPFCSDHSSGSEDDDNQGGVWYKYSSDENFYSFLRKYNFRTFSEPTDLLKEEDSGDDPVLSRLASELRAKADKIQNYISSEFCITDSVSGEWDMFISYAGEDYDFTQKVYEILTAHCNLSVWMDKRGNGAIKPGEEYWDSIQYGIEHSRRYLFIITETYLQKAITKNRKDESTGVIEPSGVYREIDLIRQHILNQRKDGQSGNAIPLIIEGTKVTYTDIQGVKHEAETLGNGMLEKLPYYDEYAMMQTHDLFRNIQDLICNEDTLKESLENMFKQ
jgi:hypothetical protein